MQGQDGGAPTWSVAVHWVHWPWDIPDGAGQGQPPLVFYLWPLKQSEKAVTCPGPGDSQVKPRCESNLVAASARPGAH